jgi:exodeoxyribonuclease III
MGAIRLILNEICLVFKKDHHLNLKIACWNVNGIRAVQKKGFIDWLLKERPHIACFQETKAHPEQLDDTLTQRDDYYTFYDSAEKKGYSGVAIFSSKKLNEPKITRGLGVKKFDSEGRTLIAEYDDFFLINTYIPNGQPDLNRVPFKLEYSRLLAKVALKLHKKKPVIICGDINTAHQEIDLARPKENQNTTGFLDIERAWIDEFIDQGFIDCFRTLYPNKKDAYTWWSFRTNARARNIGWRLDYFFATKDLSKKIKDVVIHDQTLGSDHCPIFLELKI